MFGRLVILVGVIAALFTFLSGAAALVGRALPRAEIAYMSYQRGSADIYLMDVRHHIARNLSRGDAHDATPAWSPDGEWIAFVSDRDGRPDIFVMDRSGRGVRRLTPNDGVYTNPAWSAGGDQIVFYALHISNGVIYSIKPDGTEMEQIAGGELPPIGVVVDLAIDPGSLSRVYSPDRRQIAFLTHRDGSWGIWISDADRRRERLIAPLGREYSTVPAWSPDGQQLAFVSYRDGMSDLYIVDVNGENGARRLTTDRAVDAAPAWRPAP